MTMAHVSDVILCRAAKPYQIKNILHLGLGMMNPTKYSPQDSFSTFPVVSIKYAQNPK